MTSDFKSLLLSMRPARARTVVLAAATDPAALSSLIMAHNMGFINAILCGDEHEIRHVATENSLDISSFQIMHCPGDIESAQAAVRLVRAGRADILMKGKIHTSDILRAVLNRETGIRGDGILSHITILYSPSCRRTLFCTDIAMVMYPDLATKVQLINNAVSFVRSMGVENPRVAPLCAVETLNPLMQATVDAAALHEMNVRGEIGGCIVSGPIAMDLAISPGAAAAKEYDGVICGDADILLFDNIEAGNNTVKALVHFGDWLFGGVIIGARAPIVINSRSDSDMSKLFSIACACKM